MNDTEGIESNSTTNYTLVTWNVTTTVTPCPEDAPAVLDSPGSIVGATVGGMLLGALITLISLFVFIRVRRYRILRDRDAETAEFDVLLTRHNRKSGEGKAETAPPERRYEVNPDSMPRQHAPPAPLGNRKTGTLGHYSEPTHPDYIHPVHRDSEYLEPVISSSVDFSRQGDEPTRSKSTELPPIRPPKPGAVTLKAQPTYQNVDACFPESPHNRHDDDRRNEKEEDVDDEEDDHVYEPIGAPIDSSNC